MESPDRLDCCVITKTLVTNGRVHFLLIHEKVLHLTLR
jgi:hypothetical protein